ncbi:MAG: hypothetical protein AB8G95_05850 [Anaerolineae bacterium]
MGMEDGKVLVWGNPADLGTVLVEEECSVLAACSVDRFSADGHLVAV